MRKRTTKSQKQVIRDSQIYTEKLHRYKPRTEHSIISDEEFRARRNRNGSKKYALIFPTSPMSKGEIKEALNQ